jgi:hypothetical protein
MGTQQRTPTVGQRFATGASGLRRWPGVGRLPHRRRDAAGWAEIGPRSRKARRGRSRAGGRGAV